MMEPILIDLFSVSNTSHLLEVRDEIILNFDIFLILLVQFRSRRVSRGVSSTKWCLAAHQGKRL